MNTCVTCGQAVSESDTPLKMAIKNACPSNWYNGWDGVWNSWDIGEHKNLGAFGVTKVSETDSKELDGYSVVPMEMVFEVDGDEYWKITGSWSSYDGKEWEDTLVRVEKKERTSVYYG